MAAKRRKIINKRQLRVAEIWERDSTQTLIQIKQALASEFSIEVHLATVGRDVQALDQRNLDKSDAIIKAVKAQLFSEYEFIYAEAIKVWNENENPALLAQAQNALKSIRELYGLDAPARHEVGGIKGQPILFGEAVVELPKTEYEVVSANGQNDR